MKKGLININISVLLFGLAGLFGKWILLPSVIITLGRVFFSSVTLIIYNYLNHQMEKINPAKLKLLVISGILLAIHWSCFLGSIQLSTVAIGTITFSSFPLFICMIEPFINHTKIKKEDLIKAVFILIGVAFLVPMHVSMKYLSGFIIGMISSLCYALLTLNNARLISELKSNTITMYEQSIACIVLLPCLATHFTITIKDILLLALLGIVMTALAHTLFVSSLKDVSPLVAGIVSCNESVYSIIFAFLFLHEVPLYNELIGMIIIFSTVVISQYIESKKISI